MKPTDFTNDSTDAFDIDIQACSSMDCTGLIPSLPQSDAELESYKDIYPFVASNAKISNNSPD